MAKTAEIKLMLSPERKELWKEYCEVHGCGLTLSGLIEQAVDEKICGKTEYVDKQAGQGWYWIAKPNGKLRDKYDAEVFSQARANIDRKRKYRDDLANGIWH